MYKKIITFVITVILLVQTVITPVFAVPTNNVTNGTAQLTLIENRLTEILSQNNYTQNNTAGALTNAAKILEYSMNLSLLVNATNWRAEGTGSDLTEKIGGTHGDIVYLDESLVTVDYYIDGLIDMLNDYYANYDAVLFELEGDIADTAYTGLITNKSLIDSWYTKDDLNAAGKSVSLALGNNYTTKDAYTRNLVVQWIKGYENQTISDNSMTGRVAQILREMTCLLAAAYANDSSSDFKSMKEDYGNIMFKVYSLYNTMYSTALDLYGLGVNSNNVYDKEDLFSSLCVAYALQYSQQYSAGTLPLMADSLTSEFMTMFLLYGEELANNVASSGVVIDTGAKYVENLADVSVNSDKKIMTVKGNAKLKSYYYAAFSASSVYVPFSSYTGSVEFSKALSSLVDKQDDVDAIMSLYYNTKNLRKPLYYRSIDENGDPAGVANLYTLGQLREDIENGRSGSLVTILGEFGQLNSGEWAYAQCDDVIEGTDGSFKIPYTDLGDLDYVTATDSPTNKNDVQADRNNADISNTLEDIKDTTDKVVDDLTTNLVTKEYEEIPVSNVPVSLMTKLKQQDEQFYQDLLAGKNTVLSKIDKNSAFGRTISYLFKDANGTVQYSGSATSSSSVFNPSSNEVTLDRVNTSSNNNNNTGGTGGASNNTGGTNLSPKRVLNDLTKAVLGIETVYADVDAGFGKNDSDTEEYNDRAYTYAYGTISDINVMSDPVLMYGSSYKRDIDNMTSIVLTNILKSTSGSFTLRNLDDEYLYVNVYGDIILGDDLVIFPAAANPIYYEDDTYNPFTAAFINTYPTVLKNTTVFRLASKSDIGKYLIMGDYDAKTSTVSDYVATRITSIESVAPTSPLAFAHLNTEFTANNGLDRIRVFRTKKLLFSDGSRKNIDYLSSLSSPNTTIDSNELVTGETIDFTNYMPLLYNAAITVNGMNVFPYTPSEDSKGTVAIALAGNMYNYVTGDASDENTGETSSRLLDSYLIENLVVNIIRGNVNSSGYQDDVLLTYQEYTSNTLSRALDKMKSISKNLLEHMSSVSGVIGIKSIYDNVIVATVFNFLRDNWIFFLLMVVVILLFFYNKTRINLFQFITFGLSMVVLAYVYVVHLPELVPGAFNLIINNVADNLSYEILGLDAENYSLSDDKHLALNADGSLNYESASVNIYKFAGSKHSELISSYNIKSSELTGGNIAMINSDSGVYLKNDAMSVNVNTLFDTLVFNGTTSMNGTYTITADKTVSNNIDYYMPYYQVVDSLLKKINNLATIYAIPRKTSTYNNNVIRNNYMLYSYVNSKPFVSPGNYSYVEPTAEMEYTDEERKTFVAQAVETADRLEQTFGTNADWLGFSEILKDVSTNKDYQSTLWAQTLQDNGYYSDSWEITPENKAKLDDLVTYINYQTKKFVIDMSDQVGSLSDDTMIKIVALRATIAFNQEASDFGHWLYPYSINYSDMTLNNVLQAVIISDYNKYVSLKLDTVDYVMDKYGWFTLIIFDIATILTFLLAEVINLSVPLFYLLFGFLCVIRLFGGQGLKDAIKGYLKASFIIFLCGTALTFELLIAKAMGGNPISIYFIVAADVAILYVMLNMIISVIKGWTDFGNQQINVTVKNKISGFGSFGRNIQHRSIRTGSLLYNNRGVREPHRKEYSKYGLDTSVEDYYDSMDYEYDNYRSTDTDYSEVKETVSDIEDIDEYVNANSVNVDSIELSDSGNEKIDDSM